MLGNNKGIMVKKIDCYIKYTSITLAFITTWFALYQSMDFKKISLKNDILEAHIKYEQAIQKLTCYYSHAEDKSIFQREITDNYSNYNSNIIETAKLISDKLEIIDNSYFFDFNEPFNRKVIWTYKYLGSYSQDFRSIKSTLSDSELRAAVRNCDH